MAVDFGAPYALDGTVIPGAGLRWQLQLDSGEGSGVARAGDLKITQLDVPAAGVRVAAGADLIQCRAPGRERETYGVPLFTAQSYLGDDGEGILGTGSGSGRRDLIFHEMLDTSLPTHYTPVEEWPEGQSSKLSIVQNVGSTARRIEDVPELANVTGYALAAINYPASTATITNDMIEDLREVQNPKSKLVPLEFSMTATEGTQPITATSAAPSGGQTWPSQLDGPSAAWSNVKIPDWATHVVCKMTWNGVKIPSGEALGWLWVQMGMSANPDVRRTQVIRWDTPNSSNRQTAVLRATGTMAIPASMRGTRQSFYPRANRTEGSNATAPFLDHTSSVDLDLFFEQRAI